MSIKFSMLWALWVGGVAYDIIVSQLGYFATRSLRDRILDDASIAWFVFSAWLILKLIRGLAPENEENAA